MTEIKQDFELWSGDHKNITWTVTDATGASVNLAGACGVWVLTATSEDSGSLVRLTSATGSGLTLSGCTFTAALSPAHTQALGGLYYYEAQEEDSAGDVSTIAVGTVKINPDTAQR